MSTETAPPIDTFGLVGTTLASKFRVERCVAEGGFGVVYSGTFLSLEKKIAIKVLKVPRELNAEAQTDFIDRFALEAKVIARMSHPAIVQVLDFGVNTSSRGVRVPWMALEWLEGETLDDMIMRGRGRGRMTPRDVLDLLRPVFDALAFVHEEGIAHRDMKPANIMLVETRHGRTARLMDFGIAKLMTEGEDAGSGNTRTRTTLQAFSPEYAAPEQVSGMRTGPWTDVHAMSLIVSELLTDVEPYRGSDATGLLGAVLSPSRPTPASVGVDVGAWEPVLARAVSLAANERYPNAAEFLSALEASVPVRPGVTQPTRDAASIARAPTAVSASEASVTGPMPDAARPAAKGGSRRSAVIVGLATIVVVGGVGAALVRGRIAGHPEAAVRAAPRAVGAMRWAPPPVLTPPVEPHPIAAVTATTVTTPAVHPPAVRPGATTASAPAASAHTTPASSASPAPNATPDEPAHETSHRRRYQVL